MWKKKSFQYYYSFRKDLLVRNGSSIQIIYSSTVYTLFFLDLKSWRNKISSHFVIKLHINTKNMGNQGIFNQLLCERVDSNYSFKVYLCILFSACTTKVHTAYSNRMKQKPCSAAACYSNSI